MKMEQEYKNRLILCFSWNTEQTPLCEAYLNNKTTNLISAARGTFNKTTPCYNPLFFDDIQKTIIDATPDIVVYFTEGDLEDGTWFHSDFLPTAMTNMKDSGIGHINYKLLIRDKYFGQPKNNINTVMRMSVFVSDNDDKTLSLELSKGMLFNDNKLTCSNETENVKAMALYLETVVGIIAFIGLQYAEDTSNDNRVCLTQQLEDKFVDGKGLNHVFIMGDFANNVGDTVGKSLQDYKNIRKNTLPPQYKECNISSEYRNAEPTYNNRDEIVTYLNANNAGFHDRILHKTIGTNTNPIQCHYYEKIKGVPRSRLSPTGFTGDHFGILGLYELSVGRLNTNDTVPPTK